MLAWGCWAPSPIPGKSHLRMMPLCRKQELRQERGWVLMTSFVCLDSAAYHLGTLYFVMKNKILFVYIHWNWDSEACEQKSSVIPVNTDDPYALPQVDLGLALGPNNRTQGELQVFKPVIPDWASSTSSPWRKGSESPGPYDLWEPLRANSSSHGFQLLRKFHPTI